MIQFEETDYSGFYSAIRGMRNPLNSWAKSDSKFPDDEVSSLGPNDISLMKRLCKSGKDHRKFMRMLIVYVDITAPLYWWKEFDTYKVGTVANSCSTMHTITKSKLTIDNFSDDYLTLQSQDLLAEIIEDINLNIDKYNETKDKSYWWQIIQLLPSSFNQKRTVMLNYETLNNMYAARKGHKLDEWHRFRDWEEKLPCSFLITGED